MTFRLVTFIGRNNELINYWEPEAIQFITMILLTMIRMTVLPQCNADISHTITPVISSGHSTRSLSL